jgi:hypothetical protein
MKKFNELDQFGDYVGLITYDEAMKKLKSPLNEEIEEYNGYALLNDRSLVESVKDQLAAHVVTRRIHDLDDGGTAETMDVEFGIVNEMGYLFARNDIKAQFEDEDEY